MSSCIDYDDVSRYVNAKVQLQMPAELSGAKALEGRTITMTLGSTTLSATSDANGVAEFSSLLPDVYNISMAWNMSGTDYTAITGQPATASAYVVSGALNAQPITEQSEASPILLPTTLTEQRDLVISKIASAGSRDGNNKTYPYGKYLEIYNQAQDSADVSGLYIGLLESSSPQPYTLANLKEDYDDSVVIVKQVFQVPTDKAYKIGPGETLLLVNSATDHSDVNDVEYDLRGADFEAKGGPNHVNNPDVKALLNPFTIFPTNPSMNLMQGGPCGVIIFRTNENIDAWPHTYGYGKTSGSLYYLCVPKRLIIDAVDYLKNRSTGVDVSSKRLYSDLDAGYINIESVSGYTGEVVYRRTEKVTADGRKILMDTNNSSNDFKVSKTIKPREYDGN
jgi:hypothetical protein